MIRNQRLTVDDSTDKQQRFRDRVQSENQAHAERKSPFPKYSTCQGYLDVRNNANKVWRRRYFVLNNNFLLCGTTEHCEELEKVIPLEGSNFASTITNTDTTFELKIRYLNLQFRAGSPQMCRFWAENIQKASTLKIKDIYRGHTKLILFFVVVIYLLKRFLKTLGASESQNSKVVAAEHRITGAECAIKIVDKRCCDQKALRSEIQILKQLDHKSIVKLLDLFEKQKIFVHCHGKVI
ncbi:Protein kinase domain containing protein, partial [Reticulomyxa filosa]